MIRSSVWVPGLILALLVACGGSEPGPVTGGATATPVTSSTEPASTSDPDATGPLPRLRLERVFPALSFRQLTGLHQMPDGRFLAVEQQGRILVFDNRPDVSQASLFLDITDRVDAGSLEMGLLGLALAPDFAQSGVFYVNYTAGSPRRTVVSRFTAPAPRSSANAAGETVILEVGQPFVNHNGGQTSFGPDGYLYIALGDGGGARDPMGNGQNLGVLLGKLLRIDVSGAADGRAYRVPPDNPFVGQAGARGEVWAYGLRNPWRFSWDSETGRLWLGDVGQNAREEVDVITKGGNYGWSIMEGSGCLTGSSCNRDGLIAPVFEYPTSSPNCSVTGGFVYRGRAIAALRGAYVYADYCSGIVWGLRYDGSQVTEQAQLAGGSFPVSSFAVDAEGELYVLQYGGSGGIYKIVP